MKLSHIKKYSLPCDRLPVIAPTTSLLRVWSTKYSLHPLFAIQHDCVTFKSDMLYQIATLINLMNRPLYIDQIGQNWDTLSLKKNCTLRTYLQTKYYPQSLSITLLKEIAPDTIHIDEIWPVQFTVHFLKFNLNVVFV